MGIAKALAAKNRYELDSNSEVLCLTRSRIAIDNIPVLFTVFIESSTVFTFTGQLFGLGVANILGSLFSAYPATGTLT